MKRQQGFSLVEVLVAVVVLGVIVAAFSGVFSSSIDSILSAGDRYRALMEAQGLLERVLATGDLEGLEGSRVGAIQPARVRINSGGTTYNGHSARWTSWGCET
ncbi:MAG: prepilin-type N-terminal cleavage/methylation domain-containing protein [Limnochordia bacterium]